MQRLTRSFTFSAIIRFVSGCRLVAIVCLSGVIPPVIKSTYAGYEPGFVVPT